MVQKPPPFRTSFLFEFSWLILAEFFCYIIPSNSTLTYIHSTRPILLNMRNKCFICYRNGKDGLCKYHRSIYLWDSSIKGFRLKKRTAGSRYTKNKFHKNEIRLTKIIEQVYGSKNVVTAYHPIWAESIKKVLLEYDIYIKNKNILVEYNGRQHYEYVQFFHRTPKEFVNQKKRDIKKIRLAEENEVQLIIFKHSEPIFKDYVINKIEGKI